MFRTGLGVWDIVEVAEESRKAVVETIRDHSDEGVRVGAGLFERRG